MLTRRQLREARKVARAREAARQWKLLEGVDSDLSLRNAAEKRGNTYVRYFVTSSSTTPLLG